MNEAVRQNLSKEEYSIPASKNIRKDIALVEKPEEKKIY